MYSYLHRFFNELYKSGFFEGKSFLMHKAQQTMMYSAVNKLDAEQFSRLDFTQNFGIDSEVRAKFVEAMKSGGGYESNVKLF